MIIMPGTFLSASSGKIMLQQKRGKIPLKFPLYAPLRPVLIMLLLRQQGL